MKRLTRPPRPTGSDKFFPFIAATKGYQASFLRPDILAGLTAWAMVVPEGIGYASIAGMPPQAALYAAVLGTVAYFIFGTSHEVTVGPSSALAIMTAATIADLGLSSGSDDWIAACGALAILVGLMSVIAGLLKLGFINNFISKPVLDGFVAGLALNILIGQVPKFLGFSIDGGDFFESVVDVVRNLDQTVWIAFIVGAASLVLLALLHRVSAKLPAALITVGVSVLAVVLFDLTDRGVSVIGEIPSGFPSFEIPGIDLGTIGKLIPAALGLMLVAYAETLSGGRTFAVKRQYQIDPDQEFMAIGWSNIAAGFFQGFAVNGSLSRTKLKYDVGVKTQYSTLFTGIAVAITLVALLWFFEDLAEATIAAIVIHAVAPLVRPKSWPRLWRTARLEFWAAAGAALVTMTFGEVQGLFFGVLLAIVMVTARASQAPVTELGYLETDDAYVDLDASERAERIPGVVIVQAGATPSFSNSQSFHDKILDIIYDADPSPTMAVLDFETVTSLDLTAAEGLGQFVSQLDGLGIELRLARVSPGVLEDIHNFDLESTIGHNLIFPTVREAVAANSAPPNPDTPG